MATFRLQIRIRDETTAGPSEDWLNVSDRLLSKSEHKNLNLLMKESFWRNGSIIGVFFLNGHEHATLADLVRLRVKEWKRFANIRFNFNCSFEGSDIRINFEGLDSNCQIGCVCLSPRLVGKTTMKLKLNCNKAIMLHGMYLGLERSLFSTVHMLTCNMRVRA